MVCLPPESGLSFLPSGAGLCAGDPGARGPVLAPLPISARLPKAPGKWREAGAGLLLVPPAAVEKSRPPSSLQRNLTVLSESFSLCAKLQGYRQAAPFGGLCWNAISVYLRFINNSDWQLPRKEANALSSQPRQVTTRMR